MFDFKASKACFHLPEGVIYLDGNSLGPPVRATAERLSAVVKEEWGEQLIRAWNTAGWMQRPRATGDRIARLVGAPQGSVVMGDTLSIKVFQALAAGLALNPGRKIILSDNGNFPSDLYMAEGLVSLKENGFQLKVVDPEQVEEAIDETIAVLMLTEVDYRTGRLHDMAKLTAKAHRLGVITVWDLAHSAGAIPVHLEASGADFAVGCTYKYLNGGPGAPAFIYIRPDLADTAQPALAGWLGHAKPFAFDLHYRPGTGIERMRVGTPPILGLAALDASLDIWDQVDMGEIRQRSIVLTELFIRECLTYVPGLELMSPRDPMQRGSQVSLRHPQGYEIMQALIDNGVIGDFRAPDVLRFGFAPLYLDEDDIRKAVAILRKIISQKIWQDPKYQVRNAVT
ncbi:kynureninase [Methylovirgula sp. 4M-Z18]|uniref:kynureninase n=1 Tax=Methylovirgula sp. 4M-Z18 TaxID=2293567 RepID=UPI000E2F5124|nr:kynureninase [Methylovirgula sp. 4M-Z18]RFB81106.1 kynureninase [Methylovirgula sp. 4M-Z18]